MGRDFSVPWRTSPSYWRGPRKWKEPRRIFTCSLSDFFLEDPNVDRWRVEAWNLIRETPQHTWMILTKRPERILSSLPPDWGDHGYPNVWLGTSVEMQLPYVEQRIPELLKVPAPVHFLSCEPLLGPLDLSPFVHSSGISWVIVGGESQPGARPMDLQWVRDLRDLCTDREVPLWLKQLGGHPNPRAHGEAILDGKTYTEVPT